MQSSVTNGPVAGYVSLSVKHLQYKETAEWIMIMLVLEGDSSGPKALN